ncbi:hemerythrin domain-containing protein [Alicyclobacillus mengziensis]|uniref:Hemerythrin domain-containing protein n=1 Tax=Alicyclobacillus mengziensis TaxID=2931921 RepID=A0A9X7VVA7_9BACL|nr:hemerythrin domain-containing protein [Alicyclobacillus mengziensis]QSO45577.1 hemerythrin domain-containing protein [Alicyclobacillus mengziensis]
MTGPALRHLESHHAIHEYARQEAEAMTALLERAVERQETGLAVQIAYVLIEHWETRTLCHAASEEQGLYPEIVRLEPDKESVVHTLTRDHELMRMAVEEIKELLHNDEPIVEAVRRFHLLLWVENMHSRDEERRLIATLNKRPETAS